MLGPVGEGFRYAQVRLAPARLTHCMRWLGLARRALDTAIDRAGEREAFGSKLAELGMVQERIAQSVIDIETSRALIWQCAWALDQGQPARHESSVAKAHVGEAVGRIVDRALQICGSSACPATSPLARSTPRSGRFASTTGRPRPITGPSRGAPSAIASARGRTCGHDRRAAPHRRRRRHARTGGVVAARAADRPRAARGVPRRCRGGAGAPTAEPLGDGHSNVTYAIDRGDDPSCCGARRAVRWPRPRMTCSARRGCFTALARAGVRVSEIVAICDDDAVIGAPFYVMRRIDGHVLTTELPAAFSRPTDPGAIARQLVDGLVELHAVDIDATGVGEFGRRDGYLERQVRRFRGLLEGNAARPLPELHELADWLDADAAGRRRSLDRPR